MSNPLDDSLEPERSAATADSAPKRSDRGHLGWAFDWSAPRPHLPVTHLINVTTAEFLALQERKASATKPDGTLDRDAFLRHVGELLGLAAMAFATRGSTRVRVRRDCHVIPCPKAPRIEKLPLN